MLERHHSSRKHLVWISPSFPVAVSGSASPRLASLQMDSFWSRQNCLEREPQGLARLVILLSCNPPTLCSSNKALQDPQACTAAVWCSWRSRCICKSRATRGCPGAPRRAVQRVPLSVHVMSQWLRSSQRCILYWLSRIACTHRKQADGEDECDEQPDWRACSHRERCTLVTGFPVCVLIDLAVGRSSKVSVTLNTA